MAPNGMAHTVLAAVVVAAAMAALAAIMAAVVVPLGQALVQPPAALVSRDSRF